MLHNKRKFAALLAAAALCLAVPAAHAGATALKPVWTGGDEPEPIWDFDAERLTIWDEPAVAPLTMEPSVAMYTADVAAEAESATDGYTVNIPTEGVTFPSDAKEGATEKLEITGSLDPYRVLTIQVVSANTNKLKCGDSEDYTVPYTLDGFDENSTNTITIGSDATSGTIARNLTATLGDTSSATVSGEYTDKLTFAIDCRKKTYTVVYNANEGTGTMESSVFNCGETATLKANIFTKNNGGPSHFAGWTTTEAQCAAHTDIPYGDKASVSMDDLSTGTDWRTADNGLDYVVDLYAQWGYLYEAEVDRETVNGTFGLDKSVEHSIILMPRESYTWERPNPVMIAKSYNNSNEQEIYGWEDCSATIRNISKDTKETCEVSRNRFYIDMNGNVNGVGAGDLREAGTADVYVNDVPVLSGVTDFWYQYPWGSTFRIEVHSNPGYEVVKIVYDNQTKDSNGQECGLLTGTHLIGTTGDGNLGQPASAVTVYFKKTTTSQSFTTQPALDNDTPIALLMDDAPQTAVTTTPDDAKTEKADSTAPAPEDDIYDTVPAPWADDWYASDDYTGSDWTGDDLVPLLDWD